MEIKKDEEKRREIENYIKKLELELENLNGNLANNYSSPLKKSPLIENMK